MCNRDCFVDHIIFTYKVLSEINPFHFLSGGAFGPVYSTLVIGIKGYDRLMGRYRSPKRSFNWRTNLVASLMEWSSASQLLWAVCLCLRQPQAIGAHEWRASHSEMEIRDWRDWSTRGAVGLGLDASMVPQLASHRILRPLVASLNWRKEWRGSWESEEYIKPNDWVDDKHLTAWSANWRWAWEGVWVCSERRDRTAIISGLLDMLSQVRSPISCW